LRIWILGARRRGRHGWAALCVDCFGIYFRNRLWSLKVGNREEMGGYTKVLEDENSRYLLLLLEGITMITSVAHFHNSLSNSLQRQLSTLFKYLRLVTCKATIHSHRLVLAKKVRSPSLFPSFSSQQHPNLNTNCYTQDRGRAAHRASNSP
jgi:hypothetical protein